MIDYDARLARDFPVIQHNYATHDTILNASGLGLGSDLPDPSYLRIAMWCDRADACFRTPAVERDVTVRSNGLARFA